MVQGRRPLRRVCVGADHRRRTLLDQITGEDHRSVLDVDDDVVVRMTTTQMRQIDNATAEIDDDSIIEHLGRHHGGGGAEGGRGPRVAVRGVIPKPRSRISPARSAMTSRHRSWAKTEHGRNDAVPKKWSQCAWVIIAVHGSAVTVLTAAASSAP